MRSNSRAPNEKTLADARETSIYRLFAQTLYTTWRNMYHPSFFEGGDFNLST